MAYDPYGGIQKTWGTPTYTPSLKFSGKERDAESGLDYFAARYHSSLFYRWLNPDPVLISDAAMNNPQFWNHYTFCGDNPISYLDPDGRVLKTAALETMQEIAGDASSRISISNGELDVSQLTQNDLDTNPGALLLHQLATSSNTYSYAEGSTIETAAGSIPLEGVMNLDNRADWRYHTKAASALPPLGMDDIVGINPAYSWWDPATGKLEVSLAAIAFHELAEAFGKVDLGIQRTLPSGGPGAHAIAVTREMGLLKLRPLFTTFPAGANGLIKRRR